MLSFISLNFSTKPLKNIYSTFFNLTFAESMSQSTSIPRKQQRVGDHGFDKYMEIEMKTRKVLKIQSLILSQFNQTIQISRFAALATRLGFRPQEASAFILKFPHVFEVHEHSVQHILYCSLTPKAILQIQQEKEALIAQIPIAVTRLRKLIMMSNTGRLRLEHVRIARSEFGLPDDFEYSVILKNPQFFRLIDAKETMNKYIEIVERDSNLTVCAIEKARERKYKEKGMAAEDIRFSFSINFPPGFKIGKDYEIAVWKWQRTPYWSPYEDISGYDLSSTEAQRRMEKRAVATVHELLSLTIEKKITLEMISHFRKAMNLPKKLKDFVLQHQGIFYVSTKGNHGKLHTVFLREAYRKGEFLEPNDLYLARRKLVELVLLSPGKAKVDREFVSYWRDKGDDEMERFVMDCLETNLEAGENGQDGEFEDDLNSELGRDVGCDFSDDEDDGVDIVNVENTHVTRD